MRMDKKGDIGFMEAMAAAMAVTLVLTAFIGSAAILAGGHTVASRDIDIEALADRIRISDGRIEGDLGEELRSQVEIAGIRGASVCCESAPGASGEPRFQGRLYFSAGISEGVMSTERRLCPVEYDGGTALVNMEVTTWR
mgnify:FL=1|jgi:hypothetical protein